MKIKLKIGGQDVEISVEEARQLHSELSNLLGEYRTFIPFYPVYIPPVHIHEYHPPYRPWEITCGGSAI